MTPNSCFLSTLATQRKSYTLPLHGNSLRTIDFLWGESTGQRWISRKGPVMLGFDAFCLLASLYRTVAWALALICTQVNATEPHQWEATIGPPEFIIGTWRRIASKPIQRVVYSNVNQFCDFPEQNWCHQEKHAVQTIAFIVCWLTRF